MPLDLLIRHGHVVTPTGVARADVAVDDGQVVAVEPELGESANEHIDASGLHIFPGVIDAHVHFNEPGRTDWEGWASGSAALALGGGVVAVDMPLNGHPPTLDESSFDLKRAAAEAASVIDFGLWGGLTPGNLDRLEDLADRGVVGFKAFMSNSGIDDFPAVDDLALYEGMSSAARLGLPVAVHAENDAITSGLTARAIAAGHSSARDYLASRPAIAEVEAVGRALLLAEETGCALHIVHVSTGRAVALIVAARERGVDVSLETCPHYLVLDEGDLERLGAVAKCAPPLRPRSDVEALWQAVAADDVTFLASDHSPAPADMKQGDDFIRIWGGIAGCQSLLPVLLTEGHANRDLPLERVATLTSRAVADRLRLPHKGRIEAACDADLVLVDLKSAWTLLPEHLADRHRLNPFVGRRFQGAVVRTLVRGRTVVRDGRVVSRSAGRFVHPAFSASGGEVPPDV